MSERKRVWGLYSLRYKTWRSVGGAFIKDVRKRDTFSNFQCALECAQGFKLDDAEVVPRPFYIVKKPRRLPDRIEIIIEDIKTKAIEISGMYGNSRVTDVRFLADQVITLTNRILEGTE